MRSRVRLDAEFLSSDGRAGRGGGTFFRGRTPPGPYAQLDFFSTHFSERGGLNTPPDRADQMKRDEVFVGS